MNNVQRTPPQTRARLRPELENQETSQQNHQVEVSNQDQTLEHQNTISSEQFNDILENLTAIGQRDSTINLNDIFARIPQNINMAHQNLTLHDALKFVPEFTGKPGTLYAFIEGCNEAKEMIEANQVTSLVKLLRSKITGEAKRSLKGQNFNTLAELITYLRSIYLQSKPLYELYGVLNKIYQKEDESVLNYAN